MPGTWSGSNPSTCTFIERPRCGVPSSSRSAFVRQLANLVAGQRRAPACLVDSLLGGNDHDLFSTGSVPERQNDLLPGWA